jgi:hypothetical protein
MTKNYRMLSRTLMLLPAMFVIVVATSAMTEVNVLSPVHERASADEPVIHDQQTRIAQGQVERKRPPKDTGTSTGGTSSGTSTSGTSTSSCTPGSACTLPNCTANFDSNCQCQISNCNSGKLDCNNTASDGCEVDIVNDPSNCGQCGFACQLPNAVTGCRMGTCTIAQCNSGWVDTDGIPANGCESRM